MKRLACVLLLAVAGSGVAEVIDLGTRRELFVDRFLIEKLDGAQLRLHEPHRDGMALQFDKPWEGGFSAYITVIKDGALYRMYYRGLPMATKDGSPEALVCYAESKDGLAWTKPDLGVFEIRGTRQNNVVLTNAPFTHNFSPFLDDRPDAPASEKYKALGGTYATGLHAFKSADGIHWSEWQSGAVFTNGVFDSQNVSFWSAAEQQYICLDGFISVNAPYSGGELLTKPFKFSGHKLEINFATSAAGGLRVELQDENGKPIPGYTLAESPEIIGDEIGRVASWSGGTDVNKLAGKAIRLRFVMRDADLYSLRFF